MGREAGHRSRRRGRRSRRRAACITACAAALAIAGVGSAAVVQSGNLRVYLTSQVQPYKLPRIGTSPISVRVAGQIQATTGGVPAQLQRLQIEVNRQARFQSRGLPRCTLAEVQPSTTTQALERCGRAIVGSGQFWAHIVLPEQGAYPTQGRLLVFNGLLGGKQVLLAHIYTSNPFSTSFVIPFHFHRIDKGAYGTQLSASLPEALGTWGYVDRIKITLKREYAYGGRRLSYFNAGCPAEVGIPRISYPLAFATFSFAQHEHLGLEVKKSCEVRE
jgi:hypothetical protein